MLFGGSPAVATLLTRPCVVGLVIRAAVIVNVTEPVEAGTTIVLLTAPLPLVAPPQFVAAVPPGCRMSNC